MAARLYAVTVQVSIHAPVKEATPQFVQCGDGFAVSIHAPVKGATSNY
mgnify:CR=1 FL=1